MLHNHVVSRDEWLAARMQHLEKEYVIACPYEERSALLDAAEYLNGRMREVRDI